MILPLSNIYVGAPQHPVISETGRSTTPSLGFAMVPKSVRDDVRMSHRDLHVYMELAGARDKTDHARVGERLLSKLSRVDRRSLRTVLKRLVEFGHVEIEGKGAKTRARYRLTNPLFSIPASADSANVNARKADILVPSMSCPRCRKSCKQLLRVGWCRSCQWDLKMRRMIREEIEKSA
jgi:hypothetical protein